VIPKASEPITLVVTSKSDKNLKTNNDTSIQIELYLSYAGVINDWWAV
jgi:hypothetical protein